MDTSKLVPNDSRVSWITTTIRGKTYRYILGQPQDGTEPIDTILLIHGFPDMAMGWRYQIPHLMALGYRVIAPDMMGYAGTDAPQELQNYTMKSMSLDMKELTEKILGEGKRVILGGHDWGGMFVYKMKLWQPEMVSHIFSVCTPYLPASPEWVELEDVVKTKLPNFTYQLQFAGPDVEAYAQTPEQVRQLLCTVMEARFPDGEPGLAVTSGYKLERLAAEGDKIGYPAFVTPEEMQYQVDEYMRRTPNPMRGPLNWYRTRRLNFDDEQALAKEGKLTPEIDVPVLYVGAKRDTALPPALAGGMSRWIKDLTKHEVESGHWALWETATEVNAILKEWLATQQANKDNKASHL